MDITSRKENTVSHDKPGESVVDGVGVSSEPVSFSQKAGEDVDDTKWQEIIAEIIASKKGIQVAYNSLLAVSADENERARYRARCIERNGT